MDFAIALFTLLKLKNVLILPYNAWLLIKFEVHFSSLCLIAHQIWGTFLKFDNFDAKTVNVCTIHTKLIEKQRQVVFLFLRYWGLHQYWDTRNAFAFDDKYGDTAYRWKLNGVLTWQFYLFARVKVFPSMEFWLFY